MSSNVARRMFSVGRVSLLVSGLFLLWPMPHSVTQAAEKPNLVDINTATADELKSLPGIDDAHSERIIRGRPYKQKDELVLRDIIRQATYDKIKDQIVAKQRRDGDRR